VSAGGAATTGAETTVDDAKAAAAQAVEQVLEKLGTVAAHDARPSSP
jgi:hypothetical protein